MSTVNERIRKILSDENCSVRRLANGNETISRKIARQINGDNAITSDVIRMVLTTFPNYNPMWLLNGQGESKTNLSHNDNKQPEPMDNVYDASLFCCGEASTMSEAITQEYMNGFISFPNAPENVFYVKTHGDSMTTENSRMSIPDGSYVAVKKVSSKYIRWGEVYALSTQDGFMIKKIMPSEDPSCIKCVSLNESKYPPFDVPTNEIYDMALVVGVVYGIFFN